MIWVSKNVVEQLKIEKFFSLFEVHYENGYDFAGETHNFWECVYILDGSLCVSGDERVYNLTKGEIVFHKPLELHKLNVNNEQGATLLIFSFSMEGRLVDRLKNRVFRLSHEQEQIVSSMLEYVRKKWRELEITEAVTPYQKYLMPCDTMPAYAQILTTYLYRLFLSLIDDGSLSNVSTAGDALIFGRAVNYMNSQICCKLSVGEIADFCNVSEASLKRIFSKYAGISVHKYFSKLKIQTAAELLRNGLNVTETAERLDYGSQAYFSAVFKRETGVCPSELK